MKKVAILIIDPQNDFCDPKGALSVKGAEMDMIRLASFINKNYLSLNEFQITLDSHHRLHIAHPISWLDNHGNPPPLYTTITSSDVKSGKWRARNPGFQSMFENYVESLEKNGRYSLCIWPEHCLIGSLGAAVNPDVYKAMYTWEGRYAIAGKNTKGSNLFTEHYSAVKADVEDPADEFTKINMPLINLLNDNDEILISGEALSHCVANTVRDIADVFDPNDVKKLVLLEDASSSVTGCDSLGSQFVSDLVGRGMQVSTTQTYKF